MSELALKLIRENIKKYHRGEDARFLDLGNCGMTVVPCHQHFPWWQKPQQNC